MDGETMPGSGVLDIVEWRRSLLGDQPMDGVTPLQIADALAGNAQTALRLLTDLRALPNQTQGTPAHPGRPGSDGAPRQLLRLQNPRRRRSRAVRQILQAGAADSAIAHLQQALDHWKRYATAYTVQYQQPVLYNRVGWVDIPALTAKVEQDIAIARLWSPGTLSDAPRKRNADTPFRQ